jgi:hypothetical protein
MASMVPANKPVRNNNVMSNIERPFVESLGVRPDPKTGNKRSR